MMRTLLPALSLSALLCSAGPSPATQASYLCTDGTSLTARFSPPGPQPGQAELLFGNGRTARLAQQMSADGGLYTGDGITFWVKGRGATLQLGGRTASCTHQ